MYLKRVIFVDEFELEFLVGVNIFQYFFKILEPRLDVICIIILLFITSQGFLYFQIGQEIQELVR